MTSELDAALIRLQYVAYTQRRTDPALADDLDAVIRFAQDDAKSRRLDPSIVPRLEKKAADVTSQDARLAKDLSAAVELIRKLGLGEP